MSLNDNIEVIHKECIHILIVFHNEMYLEYIVILRQLVINWKFY